MRVILWVLGVYMIAGGVLLLIAPQLVVRWVVRWVEHATSGWARYLWPVIALVLGILTLSAASMSRWPIFIQALAVVILMKGVWLSVAPAAQLQHIMQWWARRPKVWLMGYGLFMIVIGVAVLLAASPI